MKIGIRNGYFTAGLILTGFLLVLILIGQFWTPFDPGAMAGMMQMLKATQLEPKQRQLIQALRGFVPEDRLVRLEKAMQASLIAKFASKAMNQGGHHV